VLNTAFSPWPDYSEAEVNAVSRVVASNKVNYWTGTETKTFEKEFAQWSGVQYAVALMNGTVALDVALKALDIGAGDEVIVTARTFLASASCIVSAGAVPVFADVDLNTQNITASSIKAAITPRTKAIICVHLAGWPCDMDPIMSLADEHNLFVIEDCAQAHGARYKGRSVGSIGHIGAWSFCQDKIMTTGGEGGMVTTNDHGLWSRMWSYKDHGKSWDAVCNLKQTLEYHWVHETFGTNWRMMEMQAVIGRIQLKRMADWQATRLNYANKIWNCAKKWIGLRVPAVPNNIDHAAYKCYVFVNEEQLSPGWSRNRIIESLRERDIPCYLGSSPEVYLEKAFDNTGWRPSQRLPNAKKLGETSMMFLVHPTLSDDEIDKTCDALNQVMRVASQVQVYVGELEENFVS
jgi:dTDP-4-amino-4,6-dideoxygalactose transaminase